MRILNFVVEFIVGLAAACGTSLIVQLERGAYVDVVARVIAPWLPVFAVYGVLTVLCLKPIGLLGMRGMGAPVGFCIGMFPLVFSWPPYMWILPLAVLCVLFQMGALALVVLARWLLHYWYHTRRREEFPKQKQQGSDPGLHGEQR